jgi:hypothetical protein
MSQFGRKEEQSTFFKFLLAWIEAGSVLAGKEQR